MMIGYASAGLLVATAAYFGPHSLRYLGAHFLQQRVARRRALVLTYDDGPSSGLTPELLDLLGTYQAKATFFVLGFRAMANEGMLVRMQREGHEIACHGHHHLSAWTAWPWKVVSNIGAGYRAIAPWASRTAPYRPPYGRFSLPVALSVLYRRAPIGWWTIDSGDTHAVLPEPQQVADRVARAGGGVVLLHDYDRERERAEFVLQTTELLLKTAQREGMTVCRFSDLWKPAPTAADTTPQKVVS
jgi:peptidoglycan/xylan/chitin deacetylase (PgdA/CDA1 family)